MNVVFLSPSWPKNVDASGIVTYTDYMVKALRARGHNVYVIAQQASVDVESDKYSYYLGGYRYTVWQKLKAICGEFFSKGYKQYYLGACSILLALKDIQKVAKIDVFEMEESFGWHYFVQKAVDFPIAIRLHGPHFINGTMGNKELTFYDYQRFDREERAFRAARYVNAPCRWVLQSTRDRHAIDWPIKSVFFNPIDVLPVSECWSEHTYIDKQILFVGRFDAHKGGDLVIQAFAKLVELEPDATLLFAGPDRGFETTSGDIININQMIDEYIPESARRQISYLGLTSSKEVVSLRKASHITIMASRNENFPYSVLESLASAAPIIAARVGGIVEAFEDGNSGIFFKGADVDDLVQKMFSLMNDKNALTRISNNAYSRCADTYSPAVIADEAVDFYKRCISDYSECREHAK